MLIIRFKGEMKESKGTFVKPYHLLRLKKRFYWIVIRPILLYVVELWEETSCMEDSCNKHAHASLNLDVW